MRLEENVKKQFLAQHAEEFSTLGRAKSKAETIFKRSEKTFRNLREVENRHRDKMIWQMAAGSKRNDHLPNSLLDDNGDIRSVIETFEYYFPSETPYSQAERADTAFASYLEDNVLLNSEDRNFTPTAPRIRTELAESAEEYSSKHRRGDNCFALE